MYARDEAEETLSFACATGPASVRFQAASGGCRSVTITVTRPWPWPFGTTIDPARSRGSSCSPNVRRIGWNAAEAVAAERRVTPRATQARTRFKGLRRVAHCHEVESPPWP